MRRKKNGELEDKLYVSDIEERALNGLSQIGYTQEGNKTEAGFEDGFLLIFRFTRPSAGWSSLTHGELLPGRGLQPGQGAG